MKALDYEHSHSVLRIVVELYREIWNDSTKWEENAFKIEQYLNGLLAVNPKDTRALTNLGAILSLKGEHEQALTALLKAEKLSATDANLYSNIAIAKMNIESERQKAKEYFELAKTLKKDPLTIEAYFDPHGY